MSFLEVILNNGDVPVPEDAKVSKDTKISEDPKVSKVLPSGNRLINLMAMLKCFRTEAEVRN